MHLPVVVVWSQALATGDQIKADGAELSPEDHGAFLANLVVIAAAENVAAPSDDRVRPHILKEFAGYTGEGGELLEYLILSKEGFGPGPTYRLQICSDCF